MKKIFILIFITFFIFPIAVKSEEPKTNEFPNAYRNLYFGDSEEEVNRKAMKDEKIDRDKIVDQYKVTLADEYIFNLGFRFWQDQLYVLEFYNILGHGYTSPNDPKLIKLKNWLISLIKEKYGPPSVVKGVTWDKRYFWNPKNVGEEKRIAVFTQTQGKIAFPVLRIYCPPLAEAKAEADREKDYKEKEKARKKKEDAAQDF